MSLALHYAPASARDDLTLLFALDAKLADILRTTREPLIGEMRLVWWRDALMDLRAGDAPAEPLLRDLAVSRLAPELMAGMAEGWAELLVPFPIEDHALVAFAAGRGGALFRAGGGRLGIEDLDALDMAGRGWALTDFAFHCSDAETSRRALALARPLLDTAFAVRWPKAVRSLGMIATLARRDAQPGLPPARPGSPARQIAMLRHRLTGR
nr:squalene/phytoene synthase family protein [Sphingomonas colocasiae]